MRPWLPALLSSCCPLCFLKADQMQCCNGNYTSFTSKRVRPTSASGDAAVV